MSFQILKYVEPSFSKDFLLAAPNVKFEAAQKDGVLPENYHATSIFPEYFKVDGKWYLAEDSRMDCAAIWKNGKISVVEFRNVKAGDMVAVGRTEDAGEGIYVYPCGFQSESENQDLFSFRNARSRETAFSKDYDELYELLKYEKEHGHIVWVTGPACAFDKDSRNAFQHLVEDGYVHALLAGNALATHDLEAAYLNTALGQNIYTQKSHSMGHYNHLDTLNRVRFHGSIEKFIEEEKIDNGIVYSLVKNNVPFVLAGSIRDDGPLPEIYENAYEAQDAMRKQISKATTIICMASTLHTIASGNMTPSYRVLEDGTVRPVYFYSVDISEFAVNKLSDRGSLLAKSIVTNVQDFVVNIYKGINK